MLKFYLIGVIISFILLMILATESDFKNEEELTEENEGGVYVAVFAVCLALSAFSWLMLLLIVGKMIQEREP